jgi:hypothetical protein
MTISLVLSAAGPALRFAAEALDLLAKGNKGVLTDDEVRRRLELMQARYRESDERYLAARAARDITD